MECEGVKGIYTIGWVKNTVCLTRHYLGDGDTKSYQEVVKLKPHGDIPIDKADYVGHVHKRVETRLRDLKIKYRGINLKDDKFIGGGEGRLNDKTNTSELLRHGHTPKQ